MEDFFFFRYEFDIILKLDIHSINQFNHIRIVILIFSSLEGNSQYLHCTDFRRCTEAFELLCDEDWFHEGVPGVLKDAVDIQENWDPHMVFKYNNNIH